MLFGVYIGRFCVKWMAKCMWEAHTGPFSCDRCGRETKHDAAAVAAEGK